MGFGAVFPELHTARHPMHKFAFAVAASLLVQPSVAQDGLTLFQPFGSTTTFLVDDAGAVANSWAGTATPAISVYLLPDGDLLRTRNPLSAGGGAGAGFERVSYDGVVEWQYTLSTQTLTPHHDAVALPNGNILLVIWEEVGGAAAIAAGRDPSSIGAQFTPDTIYEIAQTGPSSGAVVWEWRSFDHLVQDYDASLPNFDVIADRPERIDINYGGTADWLHVNGIDYNAEFDQIALSVPHFDEIWIIDHSTTSAEAAGSTGGAYGKGGDLLYRWGNPEAYGRGTAADRVFYFIHDVQWIDEGLPGAGNLTVFNNGRARATGDWSSADEWTPPVDSAGNYSLSPGAAYGPSALTWTYSDPGNFFTAIMGGAERLPNGNTLITEATSSRVFEVTDLGAIVWTYINTVGGPPWIFKARRYADCDANSVADAHDIAIGAGSDVNGNGVLDTCEGPTSYCSAVANSTGLPASMGWSGSPSLAANDFGLSVGDCPGNAFGLFAFSPNQGSTAAGDGVLCIASPFVRLSPVLQTTAMGSTQYSMDNQSLPANSPALVAGTTWNFLFWYRDSAGGPAGFNFSDGLSVLFTQ